jgi:hypothetical protein
MHRTCLFIRSMQILALVAIFTIHYLLDATGLTSRLVSSASTRRVKTVGHLDVPRDIRVSPLVIEPVHVQKPLSRCSEVDRLCHDFERHLNRSEQISLSALLHYLKLCAVNTINSSSSNGVSDDVRFTNALAIICDSKQSRLFFGHSIAQKTRNGVRFPTDRRHRFYELHRDQTLATFAELRLPLSHPLVIDDNSYAIGDVLRDSTANFNLQQDELEWTGLAYALYLPPHSKQWTNRYKETYSFDDLVNELINRPLGKPGCILIHRLYTLTHIMRVNDLFAILSVPVRQRLEQFIRAWVHVATQTQLGDGSWTPNWSFSVEYARLHCLFSSQDTLEHRILVTGHLAEWLTYVPERYGSDDNTLQNARRWLLQTLQARHQLTSIADNSFPLDRSNICPLTHSAIAALHIPNNSGKTDPR